MTRKIGPRRRAVVALLTALLCGLTFGSPFSWSPEDGAGGLIHTASG